MKNLKVILLTLLLISVTVMLSAEIRQKESRSLYQTQASQMQNRQTFLSETFQSFPPTGWTIDAHATNWSLGSSANAGGTAPEAHFTYSPAFNGSTRLITPNINTTGKTSLTLEFKHMVDWYANPMTVGVATRKDAGAWHVAWSINATANVTGLQSVVIDSTDLNSETTQISFFFTGNSNNIDEWYIDNVLLYSPEAHDFKAMEIISDMQYPAQMPLIPTAKIKNNGLNEDTGNIICKIFQYDQEVYNQTVSATIAIGQTNEITFPEFTPALENEMYKIVVQTALVGDLDNTNDSINVAFDTYNTPKQKVVVEIGTGTWCQYCPGAAMGADDLVENGHDVAVIEYHNGDPYVTPTGTARISYYAVSGFPTAIFDGTSSVVGGSHTASLYPSYLPIYQDKIDLKTPFEIALSGEVVDNTLNLNVDVNRFGRFLNNNIVLHFALTESNIMVNWQGQTQLDFVERGMLPNANGTAIDMIANDNVRVPLTMALNTAWNVENLELVAFIQDPSNKYIYDGFCLKLSDLQPTSNNDVVVNKDAMKLHSNYPNPFNPNTTIKFELAKTENVSLDIFNVKGQKVKTLVNGVRNQGQHSITWDGKDNNGKSATSGMYFYKLTNGKETMTKKMVLIK